MEELWEIPPVSDAILVYGLGFILVMLPWLVAFGGRQIMKAMESLS